MELKLKKDLTAKSSSYRIDRGIFILNDKMFKFLKKKSNNFRTQTRICFNNSKRSKLHQMLIVQPKKIIPEVKKHPKKHKSYIFIHGEELIVIYDNKGKIKKKIKLNELNKVIWLPKNTWHNNISKTGYSIHIETISGPFDQKNDRVYLKKKIT